MSQPQVPMVIRERVAGDDRRVAEITRESIELHTTLYEHVRPAPDLDQLVAAFAELGPQPDSYFKVAELDGQVVGFLTAKLRPAPTGGIERFDGPQVFIADVEVTADARGRGMGRCLMEDVTAWAITRGRAPSLCRSIPTTQRPACTASSATRRPGRPFGKTSDYPV